MMEYEENTKGKKKISTKTIYIGNVGDGVRRIRFSDLCLIEKEIIELVIFY